MSKPGWCNRCRMIELCMWGGVEVSAVSTLYLAERVDSWLVESKEQAGMKLGFDQGLLSLFRRSVLPACNRIAQRRTVSEATGLTASLHEQGRRQRPQHE